MGRRSTYGLDPERLGRLLEMGLEPTRGRTRNGAFQAPEEILQEMLDGVLSVTPALRISHSLVLNQTREKATATVQAVRDILLDRTSDLAVVKKLRNRGRELAHRGKNDAKRTAATVIYYAAIASALVFHRNRITQRSYEKLHEAFGDFEQKKWIPSELKNLFKKAKVACQERKD